MRNGFNEEKHQKNANQVKIAVLSDIHGNIDALDAVLKEIQLIDIDTIIVAGDFVGYYYHPKEVLERLNEFNVIACRGNHEDLLKKWINGTYLEKENLIKRYGHGLEIAANTLSAEQLDWLFSLPHPNQFLYNQRSLYICHGAPWDINEYIYPTQLHEYENKIKDNYSLFNIIITGHTHYQMLTKYSDEFQLVNPGSVGQPRSVGREFVKLSRAEWAIIDLNSLNIELKVTSYDPKKLFQDVKRIDPTLNYLVDVLKRAS
jgi:putative phosphoesterase